MFPSQITNTITIYPQFTDRLTGEQISVRCVLNGVFWDDDKNAIAGRTGVQTNFNALIMIPYASEVTGRQYVTPDEWNALAVTDLDKYWTAIITPLTLIVKGECPHEFYWASPVGPANDRLANQIQAFRVMNPNVRTIMGVDEKLFGSAGMWHLELRC